MFVRQDMRGQLWSHMLGAACNASCGLGANRAVREKRPEAAAKVRENQRNSMRIVLEVLKERVRERRELVQRSRDGCTPHLVDLGRFGFV